LNKGKLKQSLEALPNGAELLLDFTQADFVDPDILEVVLDFARHSALKNIQVTVRRSPHQNYLPELN
jgi:anti-anti-sigma regulatory factor